MDHLSDAPRPTVAAGHEERDVHAAPIAVSAFVLALVCAAVCALMLVLFDVFAARESRESAAPSPLAAVYGPQEPPEPRLQTSPIEDLTALRARDDASLLHYGWIDREAGVVRIPIERALALLAERGLPARPTAAGREP